MKLDRFLKKALRKPRGPLEVVLDSDDRIRIDHPENIYYSIDESHLRLFQNGEEWVTRVEKVTAVRRLRK